MRLSLYFRSRWFFHLFQAHLQRYHTASLLLQLFLSLCDLLDVLFICLFSPKNLHWGGLWVLSTYADVADRTQVLLSSIKCDLQPNDGSFFFICWIYGALRLLGALWGRIYSDSDANANVNLKSDISARCRVSARSQGPVTQSRPLHHFPPGALSQAEGREQEVFCLNLIYLLSNKGRGTQVIAQYVKHLPSKHEDLSLIPTEATVL